ncbi:MAG: phosphate ABC transporter, permease protein PstA [Euryarchaeota archaeon]|jgi:phosphate transport system permease protein|nr:phosphate ABC transporter, permease protein PstA [Euryarchaeota archaeon]|tara:strand:- start:1705 stop:2568 length:864 start_codon:yes stop_codon:yes gene_type:complete
MIKNNLKNRKKIDSIFKVASKIITWSSLVVLAVLLYHVSITGISKLSLDFLNNFPSRFPHKAGIKSALSGSIWMLTFVTLISVPIGVLSAIYLEEYSKKNRITRFVEINIANLAGVPSIVYGILGLAIFVRFFQLDRSVLAGSFTMSLLILPVIIISSREAIRAVPKSIRLGAYAVGATKYQTIRHHVIPIALPGILTGVILSMSRAIGETAPLIMIGALTYVAFVPETVMDPFTTLPIQVFNWASRPQAAFHEVAAAGIIILLIVLLFMNAIAIFLRNYSNKKYDF